MQLKNEEDTAMKYKISKEEFEKLPDALKEVYSEKGGEYFLQVEGLDHENLKKAKDREKERANAAEQKLKDLEKEIDDLKAAGQKKKAEDAAKNGDVEALRASHEEAIEKLTSDHKAEIEALTSNLNGMLIQNAENEILSGLNPLETAKPALKKIIRERLSVETIDGKPQVSVLDSNGKPSVAKISELQSEMLENKELAPMLVASTGSGGGATKNHSSGGAATKDVDFTKDNDPAKLAAALAPKVTS